MHFELYIHCLYNVTNLGSTDYAEAFLFCHKCIIYMLTWGGTWTVYNYGRPYVSCNLFCLAYMEIIYIIKRAMKTKNIRKMRAWKTC